MFEILFKLFDLLLGGWLSKRREKKALVQEFEALKRDLLYNNIANYFPGKLLELRKFLIAKGLEERPGFREFFYKWLQDPWLAMKRGAANAFSARQIEDLRTDVEKLRL